MEINPRAVAAHHQIENQQRTRQNRNPRGTRFTNNRTAGAVSAETYTRFDPKEGVKGVRTHDLAVDRTVNQQKGGTPFAPPKRGGMGRQVQKGQMGAMVGVALDAVPVGDVVTGEFYSGDKYQPQRASWFDKQTNGVLSGNEKGAFEVKRIAKDKWQKPDGKVITWDPNTLKQGLAKEAVKTVAKWAGGLPAQGFLALDGLVEFSTGKGILQHHQDEQTKNMGQTKAHGGKAPNLPSWGYQAPF